MKFLDRVDALARKVERLVAGNAPQNALYVSNRTRGQKIRMVLLIGTPLTVVAVFIGLAMNNYFDPPVQPEKAFVAKEPTGEITAKVLPHLDKELAVSTDYSRDIEVLEAAIAHDGSHVLAGKIRNTTDHDVRVADLVFDVTDEDGSQLGGVAVRVENIAPHAVVPFKTTLEQRNARSALVRELHSR
jgi:hypothetical protein